MTQAIDRLDLSEPEAAQEYGALVRALRRKQGFGLFFVQASPAKGQEILTDLRRDLPQKKVAEVRIGRTDDRLFDRLEAIWEGEPVDIFWIEGLEQSLLGYEDMQRLAGWDDQDLMTYSWKDVPPILSHLNLGRERFEAKFDCALVFVMPLFVVKYLLRRAGDFFDWKSGFFEFPDDLQALAERVIEDADYEAYLKLDVAQRSEKILKIKDLLDAPEIEVGRRASLLREIGQLFEAGKNNEQALISFDKSLKLKPNDPVVWHDRGNSMFSLGRDEESIYSHQQSINLNPQNYTPYFSLGIVFNSQGEHEKALACYQKVIELNNSNYIAASFFNMGLTYYRQKEYKKAIVAYQKAIQILPRAYRAWAYRGAAYLAEKHYTEALQDFNYAIEGVEDELNLSPNDYILTVFRRGQTYQALKHYEDAIKDFYRVIELNPKYAIAYNSLGTTYYNQERYKEAIEAYSKAVEVNSQYATAYYNLGVTYKGQKDYQAALTAYLKAGELSPEYSAAFAINALSYD
jgi:tetratricopeptide (TPR) repeat protein